MSHFQRLFFFIFVNNICYKNDLCVVRSDHSANCATITARVTKFGENSPFRQNLNSLWEVLRVYLLFGKTFPLY